MKSIVRFARLRQFECLWPAGRLAIGLMKFNLAISQADSSASWWVTRIDLQLLKRSRSRCTRVWTVGAEIQINWCGNRDSVGAVSAHALESERACIFLNFRLPGRDGRRLRKKKSWNLSQQRSIDEKLPNGRHQEMRTTVAEPR